MSKCVICGNELLTGDIHWEQGMCNQCYNINRYPDPYFELKTDKRLLGRREGYIQSLEQQLAGKDKRIAVLEKALELACEKYINVDGISYVLRYVSKDDEDYFNKSDEQIQKETIDYFISQAKEELEVQDVKD